MPRVKRLQHTSVPMPPNSTDQARAFYGEALGMPEIQKPEGLRDLTVVWFRAGEDGDEVHCFEDDSNGPRTTDQHLCLEVEDIEWFRARLQERGIPIQETETIYNRPRFFVRDPFGNRVELTQILGEFK